MKTVLKEQLEASCATKAAELDRLQLSILILISFKNITFYSMQFFPCLDIY